MSEGLPLIRGLSLSFLLHYKKFDQDSKYCTYDFRPSRTCSVRVRFSTIAQPIQIAYYPLILQAVFCWHYQPMTNSWSSSFMLFLHYLPAIPTLHAHLSEVLIFISLCSWLVDLCSSSKFPASPKMLSYKSKGISAAIS